MNKKVYELSFVRTPGAGVGFDSSQSSHESCCRRKHALTFEMYHTQFDRRCIHSAHC